MKNIAIKKKIWITLAIGVLAFGALIALSLSDSFNEYAAVHIFGSFFSGQDVLGKVTSIQQSTISEYGLTIPVQDLGAELLTGPQAGQNIAIHNEGLVTTSYNRPLHDGEVVVVAENTDNQGNVQYQLADIFRLPAMALIFIGFVFAIILIARLRGFTSLLGLGVSALVLIGFIVPHILNGGNPLSTIFLGTFMIAIASLYLAHGFNRRTSIAVAGALITLVCSFIVSLLFVYMTNIAGVGSEDAFFLSSDISHLNFTAFFLGAVLIGALGVLADVAIGQSATVQELHDANPALSLAELYRRGMSVGREHIASLVNTLVLAYAGTSLPLIFLFILNPQNLPALAIVNGEQIADVFIQTIVGSLALVLAVPITTSLAAYFFSRKKILPAESRGLR